MQNTNVLDAMCWMVKTLVWPVALYGCETWTIRREEMDRLDAFEM